MVEGVLLGPGSGGGVVPALPELDQSGAGVFDSGMECVRVLSCPVPSTTGGDCSKYFYFECRAPRRR